jgi:alpha-mannosidase
MIAVLMEPIPYIRQFCTISSKIFKIFCVCLIAVLSSQAQKFPSTPIKVIYVIPSSHWDLGFLRPPDQEMDVIKPHLDEVIGACKADPDFRWTIESGWQLRAWLARTQDQALVSQLGSLLQKGQIELSAADGSMHTEFMGSEELNRLAYSSDDPRTELWKPGSVALMNDVPGFSLRLPQVLARSDVPYMMTGSNTFFGGGTSLAGKMPIYWESPDGSKVLMWQTQGKNGGYTEGMADYYLAPNVEDPYLHKKFYPRAWEGLPNLQIMQRGVNKLLHEYQENGYQHSAIAVMYMHDGIGPDDELKGLLPSVRAWNAAGKQPRIVVATPLEFFTYLKTNDGSNYPTYRGDWSGLWSAVKLSSPAMSADARWLQDRLPQAETLWSLLDIAGISKTYPDKEIEHDYWKLFQYDEHNGAGQSGWPKVMTRAQVEEQNREYADDIRSARASVKTLLNSGLLQLAHGTNAITGRTVVVYNPLSWPTTELVRVSAGAGEFLVLDAKTRQVVKSQTDLTGELYFQAMDVPPVGYRTYILMNSKGRIKTDASSTIESPYYSVNVDPKTGSIVRVFDKRLKRSLIESSKGGEAAELVETKNATSTHTVTANVIVRHERGPLLDQIVVERPNSVWPETVVTLPLTEPRLDLTEVLDRRQMPFVKFRDPSLHYSFDFNFLMPVGSQRWIDDGNGFYRFPHDLLPGAKTNAVVPRHTLAWTNTTDSGTYSILLTQKQSFFDDFDVDGPDSTSNAQDRNGVRVDVVSKSDQGDTKDWGIVTFATYEPGYQATYSFSFSLASSAGAFDPVAAHRFGMESDSGLISVLLPAGSRPADGQQSILSLSAVNIVIEDLKPSRDGKPNDYMLRLQEIAGKPTTAALRFAFPISSVDETTMNENQVLLHGLNAGALKLAPYETLTLRLTVPHPSDLLQGAIH